eukprot:CAMPEP_0167748456 /NCGR_PEP_ID=MMETSP0110_2-20121227/4848_1 /TAXON_ID=629695 /ORGANISM="Gymnochlora sp., Strain CCMP2014" /LENGTH=768 /DNA_ID=CAMNT_0007633473 /DNA_START=201 /DNA_END=2507 /DNA_ORIENTATION=-
MRNDKPPTKRIPKVSVSFKASSKAKHPAISSSAASSTPTGHFVNVREVIEVKKLMSEAKDPARRTAFIAKQLQATDRKIDPERKGLFSSDELMRWVKENGKLHTRARFAEIYASKPSKWLRYASKSKDDIESKMAKYQLQANLATKTSLKNDCLFGEGYFAIDKIPQLKPSIVLHLYQSGFSINSAKKNFQKYDQKSRAMLESLDNGEIPSFAENMLQQLPSLKYYYGCLVADIIDYRHGNRWWNQPQKNRVLLKPTGYTLKSDAVALAVQYRQEKRRLGMSVPSEMFQQVCNYFEAKLLETSGPLLCFEPSPRVLQVASFANYNNKCHIVPRLGPSDLRRGIKPRKRMRYSGFVSALDFRPIRKRSKQEVAIVKSDTLEVSRSEDPSINKAKAEDIKIESDKTGYLSPGKVYPQLFSERPKTKSKKIKLAIRDIRNRNKESISRSLRKDFSNQIFKYGSFIHYTKNERLAYLHGLLLRDPVIQNTILAGTKHHKIPKAHKPQAIKKEAANHRAVQGRGLGIQVKQENGKNYWANRGDATNAKAKIQLSPIALAPKIQPQKVSLVRDEELKRRYVKPQVKPAQAFNLTGHSPHPTANAFARASSPATTVTASRAAVNQTPNRPNGLPQNIHTSSVIFKPTQQRLQTPGIQTATARQPAVLLTGSPAVTNMAAIAQETPKAQTVLPAAAYNNLVKINPSALRQQQQALLSRAMMAQQKQLQLGHNMSLHQLQQQYLLMAYRTQQHQQFLQNKNLAKKPTILKGSVGKPK